MMGWLFKWETSKSAALLSSQKKEKKKESHRAHVRDVSVCGDAEDNIIR